MKSIITLLLVGAILICGCGEAKPTPTSAELDREKMQAVKTLLREKREQGYDVAEAMRLAIEAREAAQEGDVERANSLLDEALRALERAPLLATPQKEPTATPTPRTIQEKIAIYQKLLEEKMALGYDTSDAEELHRRAIEAMMQGDFASAEALIDEAIALLQK
jgi:cellobiose-specific phosphotransferase system component IIA